MEKYKFKKTITAEEFYCIRCKRNKKAKNTATNEKGEKICNGCFGLLLSRNEIQRI